VIVAFEFYNLLDKLSTLRSISACNDGENAPDYLAIRSVEDDSPGRFLYWRMFAVEEF
jgi:hypothetical protein